MKKFSYSHTMEYYSAAKRNELWSNSCSKMNTSQNNYAELKKKNKKATNYVISFMWHSAKDRIIGRETD